MFGEHVTFTTWFRSITEQSRNSIFLLLIQIWCYLQHILDENETQTECQETTCSSSQSCYRDSLNPEFSRTVMSFVSQRAKWLTCHLCGIELSPCFYLVHGWGWGWWFMCSPACPCREAHSLPGYATLLPVTLRATESCIVIPVVMCRPDGKKSLQSSLENRALSNVKLLVSLALEWLSVIGIELVQGL